MPLLPNPTTQQLEDHFFGSGAFMFGWFSYQPDHFPTTVYHWDESKKVITEEEFNEAIKKFAEMLPDRSYSDLIEDMDATDVDACIQIAFFGEIRYS